MAKSLDNIIEAYQTSQEFENLFQHYQEELSKPGIGYTLLLEHSQKSRHYAINNTETFRNADLLILSSFNLYSLCMKNIKDLLNYNILEIECNRILAKLMLLIFDASTDYK